MDQDQIRPRTASPLSQQWLRITGKDKWKPAIATVFSCDWRGFSNQVDSPVGFYHVVYSYCVDGVRYTGKFSDYGMEEEEYFKRDDTFVIRCNPDNPARSYYPDLRTRTRYDLICAGIGLSLAIVVPLARLLYLHLNR